MEIAEYINWILDNPANFTFVHNIIDPFGENAHIYQITYHDPLTGRSNMLIDFKVSKNSEQIIDMFTRISIANDKDINWKLLNKYCNPQN